MRRESDLARRFAVRRSSRNTLIFYGAFGGFGILGLVLLFRGQTAGWILIAFSAAFLVLLSAVNLKPGWVYLVDGIGITVRRPLKSGRISRDSIAELKLLSDREAVAVVYPDQVEEARSTRNMDVQGALRARRRVGKTIGFCSVPIVFNETRAGGPGDIERVGAKTSGDFVLVTTTEGNSYLLSPLDPQGFVRAYQETGRRR
jgi:hypothetical protein